MPFGLDSKAFHIQKKEWLYMSRDRIGPNSLIRSGDVPEHTPWG